MHPSAPLVQKHIKRVFSIETAFVLFLFAGVYKEARFLNWVPIDLTLLFGAITIAGLSVHFYSKRVQLSKNGCYSAIIYIIFVAYSIVSGLWTSSTAYFVSKSFRLLFVTSIAILVPLLLFSSSRERIWNLGWSTVALSTVVAIETLIRFRMQGPWEINPFGANYLLPARLLGIGIIISLSYIIIYRPDLPNLIIHLSLTSVFTISLLAIGARGPLVAVVMGVILFLVLIHSTGKLPLKSTILLVYSGVSTVVMSVVLLLGDQFRAFRRIQSLTDGPGSSLGARIEFYTWTVQNISWDSILFGHGLGAWPVSRGVGDVQHYPHNILLEVIFELGLVGLLLFSLLILTGLRGVFHRSDMDQHSIAIILLVITFYMFLNANVTGDLNENRVLFAALGMLVYRPYLGR